MGGYSVNTTETMRPKKPCPCYEADFENTPCPRKREDLTHLTEYCGVHNISLYVVKKSGIPDAGLGLFYNGEEGLKPSVKNKHTQPLLFEYDGPKIKGHVSQDTPGYENNGYLVYVKAQDHTVNQIDPTNSTMARWINDSHGTHKGVYNNVVMFAQKGGMHVKVSRKINKGDELLIAYSHRRVPKDQKYWSAPTVKDERKEEKEEKTTTTRSGKDEVQYSNSDEDEVDIAPTGFQHNPRPDTGGKHIRYVPIEKRQEQEYADLFAMDEDATDDNKHDEPQLYDEEDPQLLAAMTNSRQTAAIEQTGRGKRKRAQTDFHHPVPIRRRDYRERKKPWLPGKKTGPKQLSPSEMADRERSRNLKKKKFK
jgi:hypothetical protein